MKIFNDINSKNVHYGDNVRRIRDLFARKQESLKREDDKFFSKYWQVYAWCATIGFINDKREVRANLIHKSSFQYQMITNGSETIANALLLIAIGKIEASTSEEILNSRKLLTIISEYAEGGAKHVLEIRETPGYQQQFNIPEDYYSELINRKD